jgi:hypothetical protein
MTIDEICRKYGITNYIINEDGSINVNGNVRLVNENLTELPLRFNKVTGDFNCSGNQLTSLKGSPRWVGGYFYCDFNDLTSLEFSPDYVGDSFGCVDNDLTDLVGSPKEVGGYFYCASNQNLVNLKGYSEKIGKELVCHYTPLGSIFDRVDRHFLYTFNFYKIIKEDTVNLKRLKYVMNLYDQPIDLDKIQKYYRIV